MDDKVFVNRIKELAERSYNTNQFTFTDFLSMSELSDFYTIKKDISFVKSEAFGGYDNCERQMVRFGSEEELGYELSFPIDCILIKPLMEKFADNLTHRDFLGALMNLGIERSVLGDIFIKGNHAYVFCMDNITEYICDSLNKIKHTSVICTKCTEIPEELSVQEGTEITILVSSMRVDGVISKIYNLSRSESLDFFRKSLVFIDGRLVLNNSAILKEGNCVTVRGKGKFIVSKEMGLSKKGKLNIKVIKY